MSMIYWGLSFITCILFLTGIFLTPIDYAMAEKGGKGPQKTHGPSQHPPGWNEGEKKGWEGKDVPPGLEGTGEAGKGKSKKIEKEPKKATKKEKKAKRKMEKSEKKSKKAAHKEKKAKRKTKKSK